MKRATCGDCRWFDAATSECRAKAPSAERVRVADAESQTRGWWPRVLPSFDWCGSFVEDAERLRERHAAIEHRES